jgi:hypothetical protein
MCRAVYQHSLDISVSQWGSVASHAMIEHVGWIKAFSGFWKAIFDRLAFWVSRRKPKLYVHFEAGTSIWCIARSGPTPSADEYMQVVCHASFAHDDSDQGMIIVDAYLVGTTSQISALREFTIPPRTMVEEQIVAVRRPGHWQERKTVGRQDGVR